MIRLSVLILLVVMVGGLAFSQSDIWVTAYYPGYVSSTLSMDSIDFNAITHLVHFAVFPDTTGSIVHLDSTTNGVYGTTAIVAKAQAYGVKVLLSVGGWDSLNGEGPFQFATNPAHLTAFVSSIVNYANRYGYDGIDMDWEPLTDDDSAQFTNLIEGLRSQLGLSKILTIAIGNPQGLTKLISAINNLQSKIDQINLETSNLSGAYPGWFTWHNSAIYDGGAEFPNNGGSPPSGNGMITQLFNAGIALNKMSIGIDFYGSVWYGGKDSLTLGGPTDPRRLWKAKFIPSVKFDYPYYKIMDSIAPSPHATLVWDVDPVSHIETVAPYYRIINGVTTKDSFVSFDNERSCIAKVDYARNPGIASTAKLGGVMIWDLSGAWRNSITGAGTFRDSLLQSVKSEVFGNYAYKYKLQEPWEDASVSGTAVYNDPAQHYLGTQSIKFSKIISGGYFAMQYGASLAATLNPAQFSKLEFYWYSNVTTPVSTLTISLALNGNTANFKAVGAGTLTSGSWNLISIPMSQLNPNNLTSFNQLVIKDGTSNITYWIDDIHFFRSPVGSATFSINPAWNLISLPVLTSRSTVTALFPSATSHPFAYTGNYVLTDTLKPGRGYWLKFGGGISDTITGLIAAAESIQVTAGWNLIGSGYAPLPTAQIVSNPPGMVTSRFFQYNNSYSVSDTLTAGNGYWVKASTGGTLILLSPTLAPRAGRITIVTTSEQPPSPPAGAENDHATVAIPKTFALQQNYPNPFNPMTTIHYQLPVESFVRLSVFNILGQEVRTLVNEKEKPGYKSVTFGGNSLASGLYFYRITASTFTDVKKMMLIK